MSVFADKNPTYHLRTDAAIIPGGPSVDSGEPPSALGGGGRPAGNSLTTQQLTNTPSWLFYDNQGKVS